ncbi:MAG: phosphatidylglycerol--membrane-oligosaccharide glycerophosphotransferase [Campylobacterales bacterium]|nr:phosphatidylglycerol--membrane-oligosaccharide glycerophosphotransferase [Campylobacterales bacterium]
MNMVLLSLVFFVFAVFTMKYKEKKKRRIFLDVSLFFLFGVLTIIYFVASYFTGHGINDTVIAALNLGLGNAGFQEYIVLIFAAFAAFIGLFVMAYFHYHHLNSVVQENPKNLKAFLHNGFLILAFLVHPTLTDLKNIYQTMTLEQANDFYEYYKTPMNENNSSSTSLKKKNIVYIYAESVEKTYFDTTVFPNLTPNLVELIKNEKGIEFTNIVQTTGTNYTIAGTVSTQCGIPLFSTSDGNSMDGVDKFYPKAVCIGDVLKKENYYLSMIEGSSAQFSGMDKFYKTHSFDKVSGREELLPKVSDKKYVNGWGLYDDTMLDMAYNEYEQLSTTKEPFALFLHTLDTHHPEGHLSKSCSKDLYMDGSNSILNTVKCSDKLLTTFIKKIKASKDANNTIIVMTSDHLAMRNTASRQLESYDERRNLFVVFDPSRAEHTIINKTGTPFDVGSTVLSFLGIKTDLGLGRNLREKESLYGSFEDFGTRLSQWRDDILSFWEFPKMSDTLSVDMKKMVLLLGESNYKLPVLFKVLEKNVEPYFQTSESWKLYEQLENFNPNDRFLWVDECNLMNYIFDTKETDKYCVSEGILGVAQKVKAIKNKEIYSIVPFENKTSDDNSTLEKLKSNINMLKYNGIPYSASLKDAILFKKAGYPSFLKNIQGVSYPDKAGRWTDGWLAPSALFTFVEPLPVKFKLEIVCGAYGENVGNVVKVKVGEQVKEFIPNKKTSKKYTLSFDNIDTVNSANTIEIIPPKPSCIENQMEGSDVRKFGLSLVSMKIIS